MAINYGTEVRSSSKCRCVFSPANILDLFCLMQYALAGQDEDSERFLEELTESKLETLF